MKPNASQVLAIAAAVAVRFPSLTMAQCVYAAERACERCADETERESYAADLARDALAFASVSAEHARDCDASFASGHTSAPETVCSCEVCGPSHDRRAVVAFLRYCAEKAISVRILDRDDGPLALNLQSVAADAEEMLACDECLVAVAQEGERPARVLFVYGNGEGETVADHTDNPLGNLLAKVATEASEGRR